MSWLDLPDEIWCYILERVDPPDLLTMGIVNRLFDMFVKDPRIWKIYYDRWLYVNPTNYFPDFINERALKEMCGPESLTHPPEDPLVRLKAELLVACRSWSRFRERMEPFLKHSHKILFVDIGKGVIHMTDNGNFHSVDTGRYILKKFLEQFPPEMVVEVMPMHVGHLRQILGRDRRAASHQPNVDIIDRRH